MVVGFLYNDNYLPMYQMVSDLGDNKEKVVDAMKTFKKEAFPNMLKENPGEFGQFCHS